MLTHDARRLVQDAKIREALYRTSSRCVGHVLTLAANATTDGDGARACLSLLRELERELEHMLQQRGLVPGDAD
jgi:hypothetical protein